MRHLDECTVGGRIRKARLACKFTAGELAAKIGVSQNFLGVVERTDLRKDIYDTTTSKKTEADKFASDSLLINVASCTGTSLSWLQHGETAVHDVTHFDNAQLLLTLIMQHNSSVTKETAAAVLNVDTDTVEQILTGKEEYNPLWEPGFSNLIQRLDLPAVRKELRGLDALLKKEEEKKSGSTVFWALRKYFSKKQHISFALVEQPTLMSDGSGPDCSKLVLQQEGGEEKWQIFYYSVPIDDDEIDGLWDDVTNRALIVTNAKFAVVLSDAETLAKVQNKYENEMAQADISETYEAEHFGFVNNHEVAQVYIGLIDVASGTVTEWDAPRS